MLLFDNLILTLPDISHLLLRTNTGLHTGFACACAIKDCCACSTAFYSQRHRYNVPPLSSFLNRSSHRATHRLCVCFTQQNAFVYTCLSLQPSLVQCLNHFQLYVAEVRHDEFLEADNLQGIQQVLVYYHPCRCR